MYRNTSTLARMIRIVTVGLELLVRVSRNGIMSSPHSRGSQTPAVRGVRRAPSAPSLQPAPGCRPVAPRAVQFSAAMAFEKSRASRIGIRCKTA